jgi:hypothetical protein
MDGFTFWLSSQPPSVGATGDGGFCSIQNGSVPQDVYSTACMGFLDPYRCLLLPEHAPPTARVQEDLMLVFWLVLGSNSQKLT